MTDDNPLRDYLGTVAEGFRMQFRCLLLGLRIGLSQSCHR